MSATSDDVFDLPFDGLMRAAGLSAVVAEVEFVPIQTVSEPGVVFLPGQRDITDIVEREWIERVSPWRT